MLGLPSDSCGALRWCPRGMNSIKTELRSQWQQSVLFHQVVVALRITFYLCPLNFLCLFVTQPLGL